MIISVEELEDKLNYIKPGFVLVAIQYINRVEIIQVDVVNK